MNWMDKLERKWGRHAVANLSRYFVLAQVIGYVVQLTAPGLMSYMNFDMGSILHGQIWRIVTWIFTPTASLDVFGILFLFCVLMWGSSLESMLGTFRMNVFLWGSVILCDIVGAIVYVVTRILLGYGFSPYLSTYYILMSMLLALANGGKTRKMRFGHRGLNQPVKDLNLDRVFVTSQNHGFMVDEASLPENVQVTHKSLFDGSLQGFELKDAPVFCFQGHPEASPGPHDIQPLFDRFIANIQKYKESL